jgi:hypothetical protein
MERPRILKDLNFWVVVILLFLTTVFSLATFLRWFNLRFKVGLFFFTHWLGWIGVFFTAIFTPIYYVLKRRKPKLLKTLVKIHVFGNLIAVMLISIHYAQQMGRPPQFYPELGTGLMLYIVMFILVATGFLHRFGILDKLGRRIFLPHQNRFLHVAVTITFYIAIIIHTLQKLGIL